MMRMRRITEGLPDPSKKIISFATMVISVASAISAIIAGYIHIVGRGSDAARAAVQVHELKRISEAHRDTGMLLVDRQEIEECKRGIRRINLIVELMQSERKGKRR